MTKKQLLTPFLYLALILLVVFGIYKNFPREYSFKGSVIDPRMEAFEFSLIDWEGKEFSINDNRGEVIVLFFGYTNCPDVCPTTLVDFKNMIAQLDDGNDEVKFVMISVDPERDTPERIYNYVSSFHPDILGLSGTLNELKPIWENYFIGRVISDSEQGDGYLVEHTARIFVVDKTGALRETFPLGMAIELMISDIEYLISE